MNDTKKEFYRNKEKELSQTIAIATKELEIFGAKKEDILSQNDNMIELIYGLEDLYNQCDYKEKGEIVRLVLDTENSILTLDKDLKVKYKKPFDTFVEIGEDLNTSIAIDKTDTVIDFKDYVKYIFGKFDTVSEFKSNFYEILGIKNNIGLTTDVIPKDLLFKNSIDFFKSSHRTVWGALAHKFKNKYSKLTGKIKFEAVFQLISDLYNCYAFTFINLDYSLITSLKNFNKIHNKCKIAI